MFVGAAFEVVREEHGIPTSTPLMLRAPGKILTSFDLALSKVHRSHTSDSPHEHSADLATALEATSPAATQ